MVYEIGKIDQNGYSALRLVSAEVKSDFIRAFERNGYSYKKEFDCEILQKNSTIYVVTEVK